MCQECGCGVYDPDKDGKAQDKGDEKQSVSVEKSIIKENDRQGEKLAKMLKDKGILCVNVQGSPGSGKTTLIENTAKILGSDEMAVIQGDLESEVDLKRLEEKGISTFQINTHSGCHLNSDMINKALIDMDLKDKKYLFIENVGNLVCPAGVKIGQHMNMVISSTTEGSDKPKKYPVIFNDASLVVISKIDISEAVEFDEEQYKADIKNINPKAEIVRVSSKKPETFEGAAHNISHARDHLLGNEHQHH
ncbi:MAG: hydrogenase nickel incorporation protein HypB [Nanobdellota archaeon]